MEMTFEQATSGLIAHAKEEGKIEMLHNLLPSGVAFDIVASATNLSKQQIMKFTCE